MMYDYLWIIFWGIGFTFIYNFYAALLRAIGDAVTPLWFLAVSVVLNIGLDLFFILQLDWGIKGAAIATVAAQGVSALGIMGICLREIPRTEITPQRPAFRPSLPERDHFVLRTDLCTTVGDESGHSDGTRIGQ